jgi:hypothetical protein
MNNTHPPALPVVSVAFFERLLGQARKRALEQHDQPARPTASVRLRHVTARPTPPGS